MIKKCLFLIGFWCLFVNLLLILLKFDEVSIEDEAFLNRKTCPFCYGLELCDQLESKAIVFEEELQLLRTYTLIPWLNIKNVFFGKQANSGKHLVLKKLAHNKELESFDHIERSCLINRTQVGSCLNKLITFNRSVISQKLTGDMLTRLSHDLDIEATHCATDRIAELIYKSYESHRISIFNLNVMILSTLKINAEPLILQVNQTKIQITNDPSYNV